MDAHVIRRLINKLFKNLRTFVFGRSPLAADGLCRNAPALRPRFWLCIHGFAPYRLDLSQIETCQGLPGGLMITGRVFLLLPALPVLTLAAAPVAAQSVADFYRGKTITMAVGTSPGGD